MIQRATIKVKGILQGEFIRRLTQAHSVNGSFERKLLLSDKMD